MDDNPLSEYIEMRKRRFEHSHALDGFSPGFVHFRMWGEGLPEDAPKAAQVITAIKQSSVPVEASDTQGELYEAKAKELYQLGFTQLAQKIQAEADRIVKEMYLAAAGYTKVTGQQVLAHSYRLPSGYYLREQALQEYMGSGDQTSIPPPEVLSALKNAQDLKVFDSFIIMSVERVEDPILFGKINGSKDYYFVAE
jgi:hypothetical protein